MEIKTWEEYGLRELDNTKQELEKVKEDLRLANSAIEFYKYTLKEYTDQLEQLKDFLQEKARVNYGYIAFDYIWKDESMYNIISNLIEEAK